MSLTRFTLSWLFVFLIFYGNAQCTASAGSDTSICVGGSIQLNGQGTGSGVLNYSWSPATDLSCTSCQNPIASPTSNTTYTLTVVDDTGCVANANITISVFPAPVADFSITGNNGCASSEIEFTNNSTGTGMTYSWDFGDPGSGADNSSTLANPSHFYSVTDTSTHSFPVTLIVTSPGGCTSTYTDTVFLTGAPNAELVDPFTDFRNCDGSIYNMTIYDASTGTAINHYTVIWGDGTPNFDSTGFPSGGLNHTYSTSEVFDLQYIVTNAAGCSDTAYYLVSNITNPAIGAANPGGTTGCGPLSLCFPLNNFASNHNSTIYIVDFGDGTPADTLPHPPPATVCHTYDSTSCGQPGNQFEFVIQAINSCDVSETTISPIRVFIAPEPDFVADTGCVNTPLTFENTTTTGFNSSCSSAAIFEWDWGDGTTSTTTNTNSTTHTYTSPGNYTVTMSATNNCATNTSTHTVCVEDEPVPSFTPSADSSCVPFTSTFTNTSTITNSCNTSTVWTVLFNGSPCQPSSGQFQFVNGTDALSLDPQIEFIDPGTYTVTLNMINSCGSFEYAVDIVAQTIPQVTLAGFPEICAGDSISPQATILDCLEDVDTYTWTFGGANPTTSNQEDPGYVTYSNPGTFPIQIDISNLCGSASADTTVTVAPTPDVLNPVVNSPLCENDTAQFTSDFLQDANYSWSGPNGFSNSNQNFTIPTLTTNDQGWYYLFGTLGACVGPVDSVELVVNVSPIVTATPNQAEICFGDTISITATGATTYTWSPTDSLSSGTGNTVLAFPSQTTNYVVYGTDGICIGIDTIELVVHPLPIINAGPDTAVCNVPDPIQLNASPAGGTWAGPHVDPSGSFTPNGNGTFQLSYTYMDVNGCIDSSFRIVDVSDVTDADAGPDSTACFMDPDLSLVGNPTNGVWSGQSISPSGTFSPDTVGSFQLVYTLGAGNCESKDSILFVVKPLPFVDAGPDTTVCVDSDPIQLVGDPVNGSWSGFGIISSNGFFDPNQAGVGSHVVTLSTSDNSTGCSNSDNLTVFVNDLPVVEAGNDTTICNQPISVQFSGLPAGGIWTGPNVSSSGEFTPNGSGTFTLYYSYIAGTNCSNMDSIEVTVNDPVPSDAGPDLEACLNDSIIQLSGTPVFGTWLGTNVTSSGEFDPNTSGSFELIFSNGTGNCYTADTMNFVVHDLPAVNAGLDQEFCLNDTDTNFQGSPLSGLWSGNGIFDQNTGTFSPSMAGAGNHPITYTITDPTTSCVNHDTLEALVHPLPVADFDLDSLTCVNDPEDFLNTSTNASTFQWDFGDGASSVAVSPQHAYLTVGFYDVQLIAASNAGCLDTVSQIIEVREPPVANFTLSPDSACAPVNVSFSNSSTGIAVTYAWDFGNGNTSTQQHPSNQVYQQGYEDDSLYTIYLTVSNFCGVETDSATVRAMPQPVAVFAPFSDVTCDEFPLEFVNNSYGLPDGYFWDFGNGTSTTSDTVFTHSFQGSSTNDTSYTISLIAYNECGSDTAFHTIYIYPSQVNAFFNTNYNEGCAPLTVQFSNFSQGETFSSWDLGDGNLAGTYNATHTYTTPGTYVIQLFANNGCDYDTASTTVTVNPDPQLDFSYAPDSVCAFQEFSFTNLSSFASSFNWNFGDGDTSTLTDPKHAYTAPGTYSVVLNGYSQVYQCSASVTKTVQVVEGPVASFNTIPPYGCSPLAVSLASTSTNAQFLSWNFGNGNTGNAQFSDQVYDSLGGYTVQLIAYSANGCSDTAYQSIVVYEKPVADFTVSIVDPCSTPFTANFQNQSQNAVDFHWDFGDMTTGTNNNPSHTFSNAGPYIVELIAENVQGCSDTSYQEVRAAVPALADFNTNIDTLCSGSPYEFIADTTNADSLIWYFGDGNTSTINPSSHYYDNGGVYPVTLVAYGEMGCNDTVVANTQIIVVDNPIADFTSDDYLIGGVTNGSVQFINQSQYSNSYWWSFGNGFTSTEVNPVHKYTSSTTYNVMLIAFGDYNCRDTAYMPIQVSGFYGLFLPNAINPGNPDFSLSHFAPKGVGMIEFELLIYDDWGNLIWYTNALDADGRPTEAWDGKYRGEVVQQDSYVWKARAVFRDGSIWEGLDYGSGKKRKAGTVTIIH